MSRRRNGRITKHVPRTRLCSSNESSYSNKKLEKERERKEREREKEREGG